MEFTGPYIHRTGVLKGRAFISIRKPDGRKTTKLYSRYLMEQHLGRELGPDETVDHINEDPTDDRLENLQVLSRSENARKSNYAKPRPSQKGEERGFTHGTIYAWMRKKCRCEVCAPAWRSWHDARNVARRK